jgi:hypothetical protein
MDKYRKIYFRNFFATNEMSNFKFYYASYKIQQQKGQIFDNHQFISNCAQIANRTSLKLKILTPTLFMPVFFSRWKEQKNIADLFERDKQGVLKLFSQDEVFDHEISRILYPDPKLKNSTIVSFEDKLLMAIEFIQNCYKQSGEMQRGDRMFGYLLKTKILIANGPKEVLAIFLKYMGKLVINGKQISNPSDPRLLTKPNYKRKNSYSVPNDLQIIQSKLIEFGFIEEAEIVLKDLKKLIADNDDDQPTHEKIRD